jgi:hypothetical protein
MITVKIDLENDIKREFKKGLESFRHTVPSDISYPEICHTYFNLKHRIIFPQKRIVALSKELQQKKLSADHQKIINEIKTLSESGQSIVPYQSRKIVLDAKYNDALLNDWGIHHLHLSSSPHPKDSYFKDRTDSLLYCHATCGKLLLINLLDHQSFSEPDLFKIFATNWPEITDRYKINGILPPSKEEDHFEKKTVKIARQKGFMTMITVGDTVYCSPGGGYSTANTSVKVRMETDQFIRYIAAIEREVLDNKEQLYEWFKKAIPDSPPTSFNFIIDLGDNGIRLKELNTGLFLQFFENKTTITSF